MSDHPYRHLPDEAYWRRSVARADGMVDPVAGDFPRLLPTDRVATAGSCFAQHIARHLEAAGFHRLVTETAHPLMPADAARAAGYGLFTARYGNIYTTLQLLQLLDRAERRFVPHEPAWGLPDGRLADPFRPTVQPTGFGSLAELEDDRAQHLAAVAEMMRTLDVLVFTLGLTETWVSRVDGAAFPLCPGVAAGRFDPDRHAFRNLTAGEVRGQLAAAIGQLRAVNPAARVILTVSPVPLAATMSGRHVLAATTYSKAVLRVAAQEVADTLPGVWYFPSYEIVTGPQARGRYFADDLREVTPEGVARVMSIFLRHAGGIEHGEVATPSPANPQPSAGAGWVASMCDEAMLDRADGGD
ncbi:GSCFA domain-containing protein [Sphingomonas sp.]|uniref:GSCFA domain-containing protein n=1 Tax=Sphingomonas sp. TaxID=28214 RepID=UPI003B00EA34